MFRTLVVPLDGSQLAERSLPYAMRLAQTDEGRLVLVQAASAPVPAQKVNAVAGAQRYLTGVAESVATSIPVETVVPFGRSANEILKAIGDYAADGVVMATHGRSGLPHLVIGSVAESILARSPVPVFLVHARPGSAPPEPFDPMAARLMVPLDGSSFAEAALEPAIKFLAPSGELILVCITYPPQELLMDDNRRQVLSYIDQQEEARSREAHEYLDGVTRRLRTTYPGMHVSIHTRMADDAPRGIIYAATEVAADLVVMATHGRTGLRRAVMGSVAGEVLRTGGTPLLLVGPGAHHIQSVVIGGPYEAARS